MAALVLALAAPLSLFAESLRGSSLLTAESVTSPTKPISSLRSRASLISDAFRVNADEITVDQTNLSQTGVTAVTCRGVTSVSTGYTISASKQVALELYGLANLYHLNPAGIVVHPTAAQADKKFSQTLPKLELRLNAGSAAH